MASSGCERAAPDEVGAKRGSVDERHHKVPLSLHRAGIEEWDDVGMDESCGDADLTREAITVDRRRVLRREHLHGDAPVEAVIVREEDDAHAAAAKLPFHSKAGTEGFHATEVERRARRGEPTPS